MPGHVEDRIDRLQVAQTDIATLPRQAMLSRGELFGRDLYAFQFAERRTDLQFCEHALAL